MIEKTISLIPKVIIAFVCIALFVFCSLCFAAFFNALFNALFTPRGGVNVENKIYKEPWIKKIMHSEEEDQGWTHLSAFCASKFNELIVDETKFFFEKRGEDNVLIYKEDGKYKIIMPSNLENHQWTSYEKVNNFSNAKFDPVVALHCSILNEAELDRAFKEGLKASEIISSEVNLAQRYVSDQTLALIQHTGD